MSIKNCSVDEAIDLLNKKSGLLGIAGYSDMRDIEANIDNKVVKLAFDVMVYSIKKYIGSYAAAMNGVDAIEVSILFPSLIAQILLPLPI